MSRFRRLLLPPAALELLALALLWLLYILLFTPPPEQPSLTGLDLAPLAALLFDPDQRLAGLEHERLAGTLLPVKIGLERYGHIPAWNPYIGGGQPILNNPFNYLFNPFHSLPVLLWGGAEGTKVALLLGLLIAGVNMWALARSVGLGAAARVLAGGLYLASGGLAGRLAGGHFQLGLSLAWPPLVFAGLWWTLHSRDRRAPVLTGAAFALLFYAGNITYTLHTLIGCAGLAAFYLIERDPETGRWRVPLGRLRRVGISAGFAVGLSALQFVPLLAVAHSQTIIHEAQEMAADGLIGRYSLGLAAANLLLPLDEWSALAKEASISTLVDYAYIGPAVFLLAAAGLPLTRRRRLIAAALLQACLMMVWGAGQTGILQTLYLNIPLLAQFRFVGRAHAIAALWWILLAALAFDALWQTASQRLSEAERRRCRRRLERAAAAGALLWFGFLVYSAAPFAVRSAMILNNPTLLNRLDGLRFTTAVEAAGGFWILTLVALLLDSLLLITQWLVRFLRRQPVSLLPSGARLLRLALLAGAAVALFDAAQINSRLFVFGERLPGFQAIYSTVRQSDTETPFPTISESWSPLAFDGYEAEIRSWSLSEGWRPGAIAPGLIPPENGALRDLPRWIIAANSYSDTSGALALNFAEANGYIQRGCFALVSSPADPCDLNQLGARLYEQPDALPYAFSVATDKLLQNPANLTRADVFPVELVEHRQDSISVRAAAPNTGEYALVVRETHFPGWTARAEGAVLPTFTVETSHDPNRYDGFISVLMPPGEYIYTFRYQPPGFAAGLALFISAVAAAVIVVFDRNRTQMPDSDT